MVTFVIGIAGSGKSTYIKNNFPNTKVIDLKDFQKGITVNYDSIYKSYIECKNALVEECKKGTDVVLEHTMLKQSRRIPYIQAIKAVGNIPISVVVIKPSIDVIAERQKQRKIYISDEYIVESLNVLEMPTNDEGYENITIIS